MSASPFLSIATACALRDALHDQPLEPGTRRQYPGSASSTSSTPAYGSRTYRGRHRSVFSESIVADAIIYFFGTTIPAAVAVVP